MTIDINKNVSTALLKDLTGEEAFDSESYSFENFGSALSQLVDESNLSFRQIAYKTKLSAGYLNHLSKGHRPAPSLENIVIIAKTLHVKPDFFKEYRLEMVMRSLDMTPQLAFLLYRNLVTATDES